MNISLKISCWSLGLLLLVQTITACSSTTKKSTMAAKPAGSSQQIVLAIGGESKEGYDPTLGWGRYGSPLFQSTLLRRDENLQVVNDLATSYSLSKDKKVWNVKIREDAKFADGTPLTAEDVVYTFEQAAKSAGLTDVTVLDKAVTKGKYEVELHLKKPQSTFLNRLITLGIVPKHAHDKNYARHPTGSGPYKLVQWDEGQQLIVEANPYYYGKAPEIKRLVFLFTGEDAAFAAAKAGQVQVASVPQSLAIQKIDGMKLYAVKSVDNRGLMFPYVPNTGKKTPEGYVIGNDVTTDKAIRQAINYAIDRKALVKGILEGYGSPAYNPVHSLPWEQTTATIADNDVAQAKQILAQAGWQDSNGDRILDKNGQKAEFTIIYPASDSTRQALALSAAEMINKLGIKANVVGKSWDEIKPLAHSNVIVFGWGSHDQTEMYNLYHTTKVSEGYYNAGYYSNPAVDKSLDLAMGAPSEEEAKIFWQQAQWDGQKGFTAKGDATWAWLVNLDHTYFVSNCLDIGKPQVEPHGHGWPITANIAGWKWVCK